MTSASGLEPQDTRTVLLALNTVAKKDGRQPLVLIDTAEGFRFQGYVLGVQEHAAGAFVLFQHEKTSGRPTTALSYLDLRGPYHVTFLEPESFVGELRFGKVPRWSNDDFIRGLQLKRYVEEAAVAFKNWHVNLQWDGRLPEEGLSANVIRDVIQATVEFWTKNSEDSAAADVLKSVKNILVKSVDGVQIRCERKDGSLEITLDPRLGLPPKSDYFKKLDAAF